MSIDHDVTAQYRHGDLEQALLAAALAMGTAWQLHVSHAAIPNVLRVS
jgi:hypothetical protein